MSILPFEVLQKYDADNLIEFLTYHVIYIFKDGSQTQNLNFEKSGYRPLKLQFKPSKVTNIVFDPYLPGPVLEVEWQRAPAQAPKSQQVYYQDLKYACPDFLLDFYKSKITFEV